MATGALLGGSGKGTTAIHTGSGARYVAEGAARWAPPETRKQSSGGTIADVCLWAKAS